MNIKLSVGAAFSLLALAGCTHPDDRMDTVTRLGVEVSHYLKTKPQMLRVSFGTQGGMSDAAFDDAAREMLQIMATDAQAQGSEVFAITNMFCSRFEQLYGGVQREGCAVEGAWLRAGESIAIKPGDNRPVYFSTAAALRREIGSNWVRSLNLKDGLTGRVNIVSTDEVSRGRVYGL